LLVAALTGAWLTVFTSFDEMRWAGLQYRMRRWAPELRELRDELLHRWPTQDGRLPVVGYYRDPGDDLIALWEVGGRYPFQDDFNFLVRRGPDGVVRLQLLDHRHDRPFVQMVEFVPEGREPASFEEEDFYRRLPVYYELQRSVALDDSMYLTRYAAPAGRPRRDSPGR
jgi:hypothetical protein